MLYPFVADPGTSLAAGSSLAAGRGAGRASRLASGTWLARSLQFSRARLARSQELALQSAKLLADSHHALWRSSCLLAELSERSKAGAWREYRAAEADRRWLPFGSSYAGYAEHFGWTWNPAKDD